MSAADARVVLHLFIVFCLCIQTLALYEDQVGLVDWHKKYLGFVKHVVFHTHKTGRKRVLISTEENVIASLDLRRGDIFWRHLLGEGDTINELKIALGKYLIAVSSEARIIRAWNLPDGQLVWESFLHGTLSSRPILFIPSGRKVHREDIIFIYGRGHLHCISSMDGDVIWKHKFSSPRLDVHHIFQSVESGAVNIVGYTGSELYTVQFNSMNGNVLKQKSKIFHGGFSGEISVVSMDTLVTLDGASLTVVLISLHDDEITFHRTLISDLVSGFLGPASLLSVKLSGMFALKTKLGITMIRVGNSKSLEIMEELNDPGCLSDAISFGEGMQAVAMVQQKEIEISLSVKKLGEMFMSTLLKDTIKIDHERGVVQKVFINNYSRIDRSHGFRALISMEDHSILLIQQGEIVWSREDGLASVINVIPLELPLPKAGVSVSKVEQSLLEWLKGHFLKLKSTLMLANQEDILTLQEMRVKHSEKNKMTRDHNGFRKLLIVLTKAGKVVALHTGDGRIVWSLLLPSLRRSKACQNPVALNIYPWRVPHHLAMDENPSVLVVGKCGAYLGAPGILMFVDSYTGHELESLSLSHSIAFILPLSITDSTEQRLHLLVDSEQRAHLYPMTMDSLKRFQCELPNIYWYSVDAEKGVIKGHALRRNCFHDESNEYCFGSQDLWSIVLPSESEKIVAVSTKNLNEVVHTQAKIIAEQDVMYKYISNNLLFVATVAPKASGVIGLANPDEAWLIVYLIDTITGRILHRVTHPGSQGPVHAICSENWVVYHYFNLRAYRYQTSVIEIYHQPRADNRDVWKIVLGKHNLTAPLSSYSRPDLIIKSQTYFFTHSVKTIAVTLTAKGITSKQLLIGTINDQILALDKRFLDPRRTANPSQSEKEEGIIPLTDTLPVISESYLTHSLQVEGLRDILAFPAKLESTSLVFAYGVDLFFTRVAPSRTFDSLTEDFSYALLLITIVALLTAIFATWILSEGKELQGKWQ